VIVTGLGNMYFEKIFLLGVGLIGGSLALDLKSRGAVREIVGFDASPENVRCALERGILDRAQPMESAALEDFDLVILAIPVVAMDSILERGFGEHTLVTDVGSVKGSSVQAYRKAVARGVRYRYVPAHPIAGDEKSGPEAARTGLFKGARVIITPVDETGGEEESIRAMWEMVGGDVRFMDPSEHDTIFGWVSHMPHMAAYAIIDSILRENPELVDFSGGGLRDYTRIAASSPRMWAQIAVANREKLLDATRGLRGSVDRIIEALERGNSTELEGIFEVIAGVRKGAN
jgi:prephenate dehydrogenase